MAEPQVWAEGSAGTVIGADVWNGRTLVAVDWAGGRLFAVTVENGETTEWGDGYSEPESICITGDEALITERTGTLLRQNLLAPGRAGAEEIVTGLGAPHQVVRSDDGSAAFVADYAGGRVVRVDLASGAAQDAVTGLARPVGVALGADGAIFVTEQASGSLSRHDRDGVSRTLVTGLTAPFLLSWADADRTRLLITERAPAHRVGVVDISADVPELTRLVGTGITQPSQAVMVDDLLVVTGEGRLLALDATGGLVPGVRVMTPTTLLWPGSFTDVEIDTGVTGWTRADLTVTAEPPGLVTVNEHPTSGADPARPTLRLLAHAGVGEADIVVHSAATAVELGRSRITVGYDATSPQDGPPMWVDTPARPPVLRTLSLTSGVDDAGALLPKDYRGAATASWRVVVALVDTKDARWPVTATSAAPSPTIAVARSNWRTTFIGANGVGDFFQELSARRLAVRLVTGGVLGPVHLDGTWEDFFTLRPTADGAHWGAKDDVFTRVVTDLRTRTDWTKVDALFLVVRSPTGDHFVWPASSVGRRHFVWGTDGNGQDVGVWIAGLCMPHDQASQPDLGFTDVEVSAHELGHTLGLRDLYMDSTYTSAMRSRALGLRELMCHQTDLPHLTARHKLLLGFIDPDHVRSFSYGVAEQVTIDLAAISDGLPAGGASGPYAAVELRAGPRSSWFFEYRAPRPGRMGDQGASFAGGRVMGYDAVQYELPDLGLKPPLAADKRRPIILLQDDGDGEGAVLAGGQDYDYVNAAGSGLSQFRLEVLSMTPAMATVRVTVGAVAAPDPYLRDNNGADGDYKSPDIEIRNELSDADPAWLNRPIIGVNRVVAKVRNAGGLDAPNVSVKFYVLPFNTHDEDPDQWTLLGDPATPIVHDVPAGPDPVEFETEWSPDRDAHFCVWARLDRYTRIPGAAADEPDIDNNSARSNYFQIASKPASPASREVSQVQVHNPYEFPVHASVEIAQDTDAYRTFVDHRWVHLAPGQTRWVRMEVESKATSIWDAVERHYREGNSWMRTWLPGDGCVPQTGGGVTLGAVTAVETTIRPVERGEGVLVVQVTSPAGAPPPQEGVVAMQVDDEDGRHYVVTAPVEANGYAQLRFPAERGVGVLHYSGRRGYAPTSGEKVDLAI